MKMLRLQSSARRRIWKSCMIDRRRRGKRRERKQKSGECTHAWFTTMASNAPTLSLALVAFAATALGEIGSGADDEENEPFYAEPPAPPMAPPAPPAPPPAPLPLAPPIVEWMTESERTSTAVTLSLVTMAMWAVCCLYCVVRAVRPVGEAAVRRRGERRGRAVGQGAHRRCRGCGVCRIPGALEGGGHHDVRVPAALGHRRLPERPGRPAQPAVHGRRNGGGGAAHARRPALLDSRPLAEDGPHVRRPQGLSGAHAARLVGSVDAAAQPAHLHEPRVGRRPEADDDCAQRALQVASLLVVLPRAVRHDVCRRLPLPAAVCAAAALRFRRRPPARLFRLADGEQMVPVVPRLRRRVGVDGQGDRQADVVSARVGDVDRRQEPQHGGRAALPVVPADGEGDLDRV